MTTLEQGTRSAIPLRHFPIGCELLSSGAHFRVWAPATEFIEVVVEHDVQEATFALDPEEGGYFSGFGAAAAGSRYRFRLANGSVVPDPASRWQPEGPFGPSQVIDPAFEWTDREWRGVKLPNQVLYEMHIGTFTREGTWKAAAAELPELAAIGITVL